jgi:hypothetical protein
MPAMKIRRLTAELALATKLRQMEYIVLPNLGQDAVAIG